MNKIEKELIEEEAQPQRYKFREDRKVYIVPCERCVYLIDNQVCPFVRCIKCEGWAAHAMANNRQ